MSKIIPKIIFIRGWASQHYSFNKFIKTKPDNWQLELIAAEELLIDLNLNNAVKKLEDIIQKMDDDKITLAGHSLGGALALAYTVKHPEKIKQLIVINSAGTPFKYSYLQLSHRLVCQHIRRPVIFGFYKIIEGWGVIRRPFFQIKLAMFAKQLDLLPWVESIKVPVLILHGEHDVLIPTESSKKLHQKIDKSKLIVLPNYDHDWLHFNPEVFWQYLK